MSFLPYKNTPFKSALVGKLRRPHAVQQLVCVVSMLPH